MKKAEMIDFLEAAGVEIPEGAKVEELKALVEKHGPELEEKKEPLVRMYYNLKGNRSIIDIPVSQVEAHEKAGWVK